MPLLPFLRDLRVSANRTLHYSVLHDTGASIIPKDDFGSKYRYRALLKTMWGEPEKKLRKIMSPELPEIYFRVV